jgi:hypothetical protein
MDRKFRGTDAGKAVLFWNQIVKDTFDKNYFFGFLFTSDYVIFEYL